MRNSTSIHAGSMADIAFLMLIFFLTTTTINTDQGLDQTLPEDCKTEDCATKLLERNIFEIHLNDRGTCLIQNKISSKEELANQLIDFVENRSDSMIAPENPAEAVIRLEVSRTNSYKDYVSIMDEIKTAYLQMRTQYSLEKFSKNFNDLNAIERKLVLKQYPLQLSEATK
ncbi:MAG TPA: hypothetical protein DIV44_15495 [Leeuwenhoekiella sp.]|nr:hypothetical protein [Leeuwenhoekiella sp.]HAX16056.1 hypothetical protein [Leeuwenhoekiella sp.]HBO30293.1 hypothetical protein [Leeuwenhoekiella sp.]HCQ78214.1 hypothetical protein [Leeuwenhoekiella sp.]|tara:strand:+ start:860 stop:1372 length:513 start_codon:yes stop_codon:yes gene_type:complete